MTIAPANPTYDNADARSAHLTRPESPDPDDLVEVTYEVRGATLPTDHRYLLYSAIKQTCDTDITDRGWQLREIKGGGETHDKLTILDDGATLALRVPKGDVGDLLALEHEPMELRMDGRCHTLHLEAPTVSPVESSHTLQSDLVIIKNGNRAPQGYRTGDLGAKIGARLGAWLGRADFGVTLGERRIAHIAGVRYYGNPVRLTALTPDESRFLQASSLGARPSMGCGTFWPCEDGLEFA